MIPDEIIEQVRDSADLLSIVGESVALKRTGSDYRGPCPFHGGTHRNFAVIPKKNLYYCYVCHAAGDVFSYLMKRFGMDYPTAVREAARRSGITIPETGARSGPDPREPLFSAVAAAQDWFARMLVERPEGQGARDYLAGRDVPLEEAAQRGLGFAPPGTAFLGAMRELGLADAVLLEAGLLFKRDDGSLVPRFRGRLLFPIHDLRGRVVGFGGRLMGPGEPKYLNSPDTALFHKGRLLYNLHSAKNAIRREESVVLVEGYFDVLRLVLAGIEHVVAPLGTALTPDQAALLKRVAPAAVLLYDSDSAGLRATFRAGDELLRHAVRVRVATMPPGEDPDTLVRAGGAKALTPVLADAVDVLERKIQLLERKGWFEGIEHRRNALDRLLPTIRATADSVTRELYISQVAERVGVPREVVATEARSRAGAPASAPANAAPRSPGGADVRSRASGPSTRREGFGVRAERQLLSVIIAAPEWRDRAREEVEPSLFEGAANRELFEVLRQLPAGAAQDQLPDGLSEAAQAVWTTLRESIATLGTAELDEAYTGALQRLQARPFYRRIQALTDPAEKRRQLDELDRKYPAFRKVRGYVRGAPTPRRGPRGVEHHPGKDRNAP
ncbi:MAG TPA: DNA primase [Gemmatimonadales bacterium]|nr:DNA primase [Gemmatimonadales bacterium]